MRSYLLALAAVMAAASPAAAQIYSGPQARSHRAVYMPRASHTQTRYARQTNVEATVESHGYATRYDGCNSCNSSSSCSTRRCCKPALLPSVVDNLQDALLCLIPTRSHCCPYPKTCREPSCSNQPVGCCNRQPLLNSLFASSSCARPSRSQSCCAPAPKSCGCTAGEAHGLHLMAPPQVEEPLPPTESPFRDDPVDMPTQRGAKKPSQATKTTQQWFKKSNAAPVRYTSTDEYDGPEMIIVGNAAPIIISE